MELLSKDATHQPSTRFSAQVLSSLLHHRAQPQSDEDVLLPLDPAAGAANIKLTPARIMTRHVANWRASGRTDGTLIVTQ